MAGTDERDAHVWRFFRAGGFDQVRIDTGADIAALARLDQKLWVALACPTRGVEFDARTLDLIDTDGDGRIRAPELLAAAAWAVGLLRRPDDLVGAGATLPLAAINDAAPEGTTVLASARTILRMLERPDAAAISLQDTLDIETALNHTDFNGDGIVPAAAAEDEATRTAMADIIDCLGAETDRSGRPGVSQDKVDRFFAAADAYARWWSEAESDPALLPLDADTAAAAALVRKLRPKLDDYFARCRIVEFDPRALDALDPALPAYAAIAAQTVVADEAEIAALPIARIAAGKPLPLGDGINPAWAEAIAAFGRLVVTPLLGARASLEEAEWRTIEARLAAHEAWAERKPPTALEKLGPDRIRALAGSALASSIGALIARDKALEPEMTAIAAVEKLIRFRRDLAPLLNNFVSFRDFYTRSGKALFQAGTLYLDGRSCELCVTVDDETRHAQLATLSRIYLAYCRCTRRGAAEKMTIAAAFTAGDSDNLLVGRNGVFYDRKGRDWDATIVKIIEHPISIRQAFWLPYKQFARAVSDLVQKFAAARASATSTGMTQTLTRIGGPAPAPAPAPTAAAATQEPPAAREPAFDAARFAGIFAAIGLAIGAIGTAVASIVTGLLRLAWWQMPLALLGIALVVSGPSVLIAALKLRNRNLGPILDACGWAVNARLRINIPFGTALTLLAKLPERAERSFTDPYAEKKRPWRLYLGAAVVVAIGVALWWFGFIADWIGRW
ncbi:MAG TPA: hypothetical protein VMU87_00090 [Stellaceae bacterium]|nr:hypothetical protein [Stellaceae bacterium]